MLCNKGTARGPSGPQANKANQISTGLQPLPLQISRKLLCPVRIVTACSALRKVPGIARQPRRGGAKGQIAIKKTFMHLHF